MIRDEGLVFGHGTVLVRMACNQRGEFELVLHQDEERRLTLLSAVYGRQISPRIMHHVRRASEQCRRGERVMDKLFRAAERETGAVWARGAAPKWYFAEEYAANYVRGEFAKGKFKDIVIRYMRPRNR